MAVTITDDETGKPATHATRYAAVWGLLSTCTVDELNKLRLFDLRKILAMVATRERGRADLPIEVEIQEQ